MSEEARRQSRMTSQENTMLVYKEFMRNAVGEACKGERDPYVIQGLTEKNQSLVMD